MDTVYIIYGTKHQRYQSCYIKRVQNVKASLQPPVNVCMLSRVHVISLSVTLQHIYSDADVFLHSDEWMEDDVLPSPSAAVSSHDGLKSPPPYSLQPALTTFGNASVADLYNST